MDLINRGHAAAYEPAMLAATAAIQSNDSIVKQQGLQLLQALVEQAMAFDEAAEAVTATILSADTRDAAQELFAALVNQVGTYDSAARVTVSLWNRFKSALFG